MEELIDRHGVDHVIKEFVLASNPIAKFFPEAARAPPRLEFGRYEPPDEAVYGRNEDITPMDVKFDQSPQDSGASFNQDIAPSPEFIEGW